MLNQKNILPLALKIMGIYVLTKAIQYIPAVVSTLPSLLSARSEMANNKFSQISILVTFILMIGFGLWLLLKKNKSINNETETVKIENNADLFTLGFAISGIFIFTIAVVDLPYLVIQLFNQLFSNYSKILLVSTNREIIGKIIGNIIELSLGILLFFKARYFTKFIK